MHAADADLALARARCLYALGRYASGMVVIGQIEAPADDFRAIGDALVRLKLIEHTETDRTKVVEAYAATADGNSELRVRLVLRGFPHTGGMKAEALAVIRQVEETKQQLDSMGQPFDRPWMRRVLRLRARSGSSDQAPRRRTAGQPAGRRVMAFSYTR